MEPSEGTGRTLTQAAEVSAEAEEPTSEVTGDGISTGTGSRRRNVLRSAVSQDVTFNYLIFNFKLRKSLKKST